jgi:hypothetical protein
MLSPPNSSWRTRSTLALALLALGVLLALSTQAPPIQGAGPYGPEYKSCSSFEAEYHIRVYATHMPCRKAVRIQREYWLGPESRKTIVNGGVGCCGWILLDRFPGWKCFSGAGGGSCKKGRKVAAYQNGPA